MCSSIFDKTAFIARITSVQAKPEYICHGIAAVTSKEESIVAAYGTIWTEMGFDDVCYKVILI